MDSPLAVLLLMATLLGISSVSFGAISRAAWTRVVARGPELDRAFAFEAISEDVAFIVAPSAAIPLTLSVHPSGGLIASLLLTSVASVWLYHLPDRMIRRPHEENPETASRTGRRRSIFSVPGLRVLLGALFFFGMVFGAIELMLVAFAREVGNEPLATLLLVLIAIGSCIGGLTYGAVRWRIPAIRRLMLLGGAFAIALVPIVFVTNIPLMAVVILFAGFFISPAIIAAMTLTERLTSRQMMTESFAWIGSSISIGAAVGIFGGGRLIDEFGANGAQVFVVSAGFLSTITVFLFRHLLIAEDPPETA
jgi:predicted MFS family arabinose efflux permease